MQDGGGGRGLRGGNFHDITAGRKNQVNVSQCVFVMQTTNMIGLGLITVGLITVNGLLHSQMLESPQTEQVT